MFLLLIIDYRTDASKRCRLRDCAKIFSKYIVNMSFIHFSSRIYFQGMQVQLCSTPRSLGQTIMGFAVSRGVTWGECAVQAADSPVSNTRSFRFCSMVTLFHSPPAVDGARDGRPPRAAKAKRSSSVRCPIPVQSGIRFYVFVSGA